MPRVDVGVGEGDIARVVAADEGERLSDGAFGQYATAGEIDPQIERGGRAAGVREPGDERIVHGP